ncbi:MAG TPA: HRDC domain-containing protein [Anaerolineales bacterium]|nr:HRDC domain-containing protein [Anaerolineales bacterium]
MPAVDLPPPTLITRPQALKQLLEQLLHEPIVAVDTESNSLYAYQEQVCLIQFSTNEEDFLVDPLALADLSPLSVLFSNPEIEKVFHAAEYDVLTLKRDFGYTFKNLFDTMLAARILGWKEFGLGPILRDEFGIRLNKRYQRANWGRRPLPADMLDYARFDTHFLIPLRDRLQSELKDQNRWDLAMEDFDRLRHINGRAPEDLAEACWKVSGSYDLDPQQAAVLQELCLYRDGVARELDRPLFKVIHDRSLLAIAKATPENLKELRRLPGMTNKQVRRHGQALLNAVQRGLRAEPKYPPSLPRPDNGYLDRVDALRYWRKKTARKMGVNSDVVLPRDLLYSIASRNPHTERDLQAVLEQVPWRRQRFGDQILEVLDGV